MCEISDSRYKGFKAGIFRISPIAGGLTLGPSPWRDFLCVVWG